MSASESEPIFDLEAIYDERISPLMSEIIAICKEHNLPMLATFFYQRDEENGLCTTALLGKQFAGRGVPENILKAHGEITRGRGNVQMFRATVTKADGSTETTVTAILP